MKKFHFPLASAVFISLLTVPSARAQTEKLPDLIVTDVQFAPQKSFAGEPVTLQATVKNQGEAPTPEGIILGGVWKINGESFAYTDKNTRSLAPGESVTLQADGGGDGEGRWLPRAGTYRVGFLIEDANRIQEGNKNNNLFTSPQTLSVTGFSNGPDLLIQSVKIEGELKKGAKIALEATIFNAGNLPTSREIPLQVDFLIGNVRVASGKIQHKLWPGQSVVVRVKVIKIGVENPLLTAIVDPHSQIKERRIENNLWQSKVSS